MIPSRTPPARAEVRFSPEPDPSGEHYGVEATRLGLRRELSDRMRAVISDEDEDGFFHEARELVRLAIRALKKYLDETAPALTTLKGDLLMDYPLTVGDSVVVTLTDTDNTTLLPVTIDPGSVTAVLSNTSDSVVVDPSGTFLTITAGTTPVTGATVTVNGTSGGVASDPWVGTYDVVPAVVAPTSTLSGSFGTETAPAAASSTGTLPVDVTLPGGQVLPAGSPLPAGTKFTETAELLNTDGSVYTGS